MIIWIKIYLALNNLQTLICQKKKKQTKKKQKKKQPTNQQTNQATDSWIYTLMYLR